MVGVETLEERLALMVVVVVEAAGDASFAASVAAGGAVSLAAAGSLAAGFSVSSAKAQSGSIVVAAHTKGPHTKEFQLGDRRRFATMAGIP